MMREGTLAVAISNTGATVSIVELARLARENGASVIAITGSRTTPLADYADVVTDVRDDVIRFGFGLYQDDEDVERLIKTCARLFG